jgi:hypothetical protein
MKKILLTLLTFVSLSTLSLAQAPEKFSYQAVIRDPSSNLVANQIIGVQMKIRQGLVTGTVVYSETFLISTNSYGLINLEIGNGITMDNFQTIDWANGPYYIETLADLTGGTTYVSMGTSQLLSVPYALHAKSAETVINDAVNDADADPTNEIQSLSITGNQLTITDGNTVQIPGTLYHSNLVSGGGNLPATTLDFLTTTATVTITSSTQKVHWVATKALGSTAASGANSLGIYAGYKLTSAPSISTVGGGILGLRCASNTRQTYTISGYVTGLAPGTYVFGMAGSSSDSANWNSHEYGYVTILVFN